MSLPFIMFMAFAEVLAGRGQSFGDKEVREGEDKEDRHSIQVLNIIQKVSEPVIHLKVADEEQWTIEGHRAM